MNASRRPESIVSFRTDDVVVRIGSLDAGQRLDRFLRKLLPGARLVFLHKSIDRGRVQLDGARARAGTRIQAGQIVRLPIHPGEWEALRGESPRSQDRPGPRSRVHDFGEPADGDVEPRPVSRGPAPRPTLSVVFEDDLVLAVSKPAGQLTHGHATSLTEAVRAELRADGASLTFRPAPAHRLDRDTSGIVVFGKTPAAQRSLAAAFRERTTVKRYQGVVYGAMPPEGVIRSRLVRMDRPRGPKMKEGAGGKPAETAFRRLAAAGRLSWLELEPWTGRTHQIRVQLAEQGHPLLGDRRYGHAASRQLGRQLGLERLFLHASHLEIAHPGHGRTLELEAPLPEDLERVVRTLNFRR